MRAEEMDPLTFKWEALLQQRPRQGVAMETGLLGEEGEGRGSHPDIDIVAAIPPARRHGVARPI